MQLSKYVYSANPVESAADFVGRDSHTRLIEDGINKRLNVVAFGGPKSGKTSLLLHIGTHLRHLRELYPDVHKVIPVLMDVRLDHLEKPDVFCRRIWESLLRSALAPALHGREGPPQTPKPIFNRRTEPWPLLQQSCEALWAVMPASVRHYCLLIDDFDALSTPSFAAVRHGLWQFAQLNEAFAPRSVVVAGGPRTLDAIQQFDKQSTRHSRIVPLGVFNPSDALALAQAGFAREQAPSEEALSAYTGRHPFMLQLLLGHLRAEEIEELSDAALYDAVLATRKSWQAWFEGIAAEMPQASYRQAEPTEHRLMRLLIEHAIPLSLSTCEQKLDALSLVRRACDFLEALGVVEKIIIADVPHWRAHFTLWNDWYRTGGRR